jgi:protein-S-isoprenylcysteine O-methyltransferase Ste14
MEHLFVWCGGALFVSSIAFCAYTYFVRWTEVVPYGGWVPWLVNSTLVAVFAIHHSVFARDSAKRVVSRFVRERLVRSVYVWAAALLLFAVCGFWMPIGGEIYRAHGWAAAVMTGVQLFGVLFIARSVANIDPLDLSGIRQVRSKADRVDIRPPEQLQVVGPYRIVRHPLYFGWVLVVFGTPHLTADRLAFAVLTTLYLVMAIPWEERSLTAVFGRDYDRYKKEVPWRLVPYVY